MVYGLYAGDFNKMIFVRSIIRYAAFFNRPKKINAVLSIESRQQGKRGRELKI